MHMRRVALSALLAASVLFPQQSQGQEKQRVSQSTPASETAEGKKKKNALQLLKTGKAFLATLTDEQTAKAQLEYGSEKRVGWHFIPKDTRKGLPLTEMNPEQKQAAMKLLRSAVSQLGYAKTTKIMQLESVLLKLEGPEGKNERNPEKYYFTIFGEPAWRNKWGLSFEGHHVSLNFVVEGNRIIDSTPQFMASNPSKLPEDYGEGLAKGLQVLRAEEQMAFALVRSLSEEQLEKAMLPGEVPGEIRGAGSPQPPTDDARGIASSDLDEEQQSQLKKLMRAYTQKMKQLVSKERWKLIDEAGFENVKFAWSGAKKPGRGHYYTVQGPTFLIEFVNVQADAAGNPASHVHCVWRDMQGDFDLAIAAE